jgi:hypothetical protein
MDPADAHAQPAQAPGAADAQLNGAAAAPGPSEQPQATAESPEAAAARMAANASREVGGMVARLDQLETRVARVDRQVLMLIGMFAVLAWSVKSIAGKLELADAAAAATPTG